MTSPPRTWPEQQQHERWVGGQATRCEWVKSLAALGVSASEAARRADCPQTTLQRFAKNYGVKFTRVRVNLPSAVDGERLLALSAEGATTNQAAKALGVSYNAVRSYAKNRGIPLAKEVRPVKHPRPVRKESGAPSVPAPVKREKVTGLDLMAMFAARENAAMQRVGRR